MEFDSRSPPQTLMSDFSIYRAESKNSTASGVGFVGLSGIGGKNRRYCVVSKRSVICFPESIAKRLDALNACSDFTYVNFVDMILD